MKTRVQLFQGVAVLYLVFLLGATLLQLFWFYTDPLSLVAAPRPKFSAGDGISPAVMGSAIAVGMMLRCVILAGFIAMILRKPKTWGLVLGFVFIAESAVTCGQLIAHWHHRGIEWITFAGRLIDRSTVIWLLCFVPLVCAVCCFAIWRDLRKVAPNNLPEATPSKRPPSLPAPSAGAPHL